MWAANGKAASEAEEHALYTHEVRAPQNRKVFNELQSENLTTSHFQVICVYYAFKFRIIGVDFFKIYFI